MVAGAHFECEFTICCIVFVMSGPATPYDLRVPPGSASAAQGGLSSTMRLVRSGTPEVCAPHRNR
jgi:hypothetical protein